MKTKQHISPLRIAFGHRARTGKDEACKYLSEKYGGTTLAFSDPLYNILYYAQRVCNFPLQKDRKFLQWVGTDWGRHNDENVWAKILVNKIDRYSRNTNIYVSDLRFKNEMKLLKKEGFVCVRLDRNIGKLKHISEDSLDSFKDWDYIIKNNGTLEEFHNKLDNIIKDLKCYIHMKL